jgi:superfamily II DNA or RNA helicase
MRKLFDGTTAEARDYQVRACEKTLDLLVGPEPVNSVLLDSPTGSGKTVMGLALARYGVSVGKTVGWVAMRRNLLRQAADMAKRFGFGLEGMHLISMFDRSPPEGVDWLFVDEAQHDATQTMAHIHSVAKPERVIGLSATPYRTDRAKLSFDRVVKEVGIQELIDAGYLSQYDHFTIPAWTPEEVVRCYLRDPEDWGRSVMFFLTMEECRRTESLLRAAGVRCELVWGGSDREAQIDALRSGAAQVAISMSLLAEGLDVEELTTVFVRPSKRGPTLQMAGRVLRTYPGCPVKKIVQCGETRYPFIRAARPRASYALFGDSFLSMEPNANVESISKACLDRLVHGRAPGMPRFIIDGGRTRRALEDRRERRGSRPVDRGPRGVRSPTPEGAD